MILPLFKAKTVETDSYNAGITVIGDFVYTPPYTNSHGLKIGAGYEIWEREEKIDNRLFDSYFAIDPDFRVIS